LSNKSAIRLMKDKFVGRVRSAASELYSKPVKLNNAEDAPLIGAQMVQWLVVRLEHKLPVNLQRDHMIYRPVPVTTDTSFSIAGVQAVAAR
jgi:hypothetical protein